MKNKIGEPHITRRIILVAAAFTAALTAPLSVSAAGGDDQVSAAPSFTDARTAQQDDFYASKAIARKDWLTAIEKLEVRDDKDPFRMLNLAVAYQNVGRQAEAVALYQQVLRLRANPYADLGAKSAPRRVKAIARDAVLASAETGQ